VKSTDPVPVSNEPDQPEDEAIPQTLRAQQMRNNLPLCRECSPTRGASTSIRDGMLSLCRIITPATKKKL